MERQNFPATFSFFNLLRQNFFVCGAYYSIKHRAKYRNNVLARVTKPFPPYNINSIMVSDAEAHCKI